MMLDSARREEVQNIVSEIESDIVRDKRVLITGGAGFIGSWLCDALVASGAYVHCIDNLSAGRTKNIDHLNGNTHFSFKKCDVTGNEIPKEGYDFIFHLASRASPEEYQAHPIETLLANSSGTRNLLELSRRSKATLIYASTSEIYGNPEVFPTPETYWGRVNPIGARSCYDEGKRFGEAMCAAYGREYGMDVRVARIFNTYGPRIRPDGPYARVIPRFVMQAMAGSVMTVYGDGSQTRSFSYFTDIVTGFITLATSRKARGEVVNLGNPEEISVIALADKIKRILGSKSRIVRSSLPEDDPSRRLPDVSKAYGLLGWRPKVPLDVGLKRTIDWFTKGLS